MRKLTDLFFVPIAWAILAVPALADPMFHKQGIELLGGPGDGPRQKGTTAKIIFVHPTLSETNRCEAAGTRESRERSETVLIYRNGKPSLDQTSKGLCPSSDIPMSSGKVDCESGSIGACLNKD